MTVYPLTRGYPAFERFALASQTQRAATSVIANIAEGCGRRTRGEMLNALSNASGSLSELHCHVLEAHDLGYMSRAERGSTLAAIMATRKLLVSLMNAIGRSRRIPTEP